MTVGDRYDERLDKVENSILELQLSRERVEGRLKSIDHHVEEIKRKLDNGISVSLAELQNKMNALLPQLENAMNWATIYKNATLVAIGGILTGAIGFIINRIISNIK